jgi:hypothetical protein
VVKVNKDYILEQMKNEIAAELGIEYGANQTSRLNGKIGGEMVRRMIILAEEMLQQNKQ